LKHNDKNYQKGIAMNVFPIMKKVPGDGVGIQLAGWCDFAATIRGAILCIHGL